MNIFHDSSPRSMFNMLLIASSWQDKATFKLIPAANSCVFNEALYDPESQTLVVVSKEHKPGFQMVPKLDQNGNPLKVVGTKDTGHQMQRVSYDAYYQYELTNVEDIRTFVAEFARNPDHAAFRAFFPATGTREEPVYATTAESATSNWSQPTQETLNSNQTQL